MLREGSRQTPVEHLVQAAAVDVAAFYAAHIPMPQSADMLLVLSVDGKGIIMRPGHLREATRKAAERAKRTFRTRPATGEKAGRKRTAHDIISPPGGRSGERAPRPGPKAQEKWLTESVEHDPEHVLAAAFDQVQARDHPHRPRPGPRDRKTLGRIPLLPRPRRRGRRGLDRRQDRPHPSRTCPAGRR